MILIIYILVAIVSFFDVPMLPIIVVGAVLQCYAAYIQSKNSVYLKIAAAFLMLASIPHMLIVLAPDSNLSSILSAPFMGISRADYVTWVFAHIIYLIPIGIALVYRETPILAGLMGSVAPLNKIEFPTNEEYDLAD